MMMQVCNVLQFFLFENHMLDQKTSEISCNVPCVLLAFKSALNLGCACTSAALQNLDI